MKTYPFLMLPLLLVGCSSAPTKDTFSKAIQSALQADPKASQLCRTAPPPIQQTPDTIDSSFLSPKGLQELQMLEKYGYITVTKSGSNVTDTPTAKYLKVFGTPSKNPSTICYGQLQLKEVSDFTAPADGPQGKSSIVDYTLTSVLDANNPLTKDTEVMNWYHFMADPVISRKALVVQKDSGWVVQNLDYQQ